MPEETTRTDQATSEKVKEVERSTRSYSKHQASRNTKQVDDQSESKSQTQACGKMRRKHLKKLDEASRPRPAKRQAKSKISEVEGRKLPKDASVNKDHHKPTEARRQSTTDFSLKSSTDQGTSKGGMTVSKTRLPTNKPNAHRQAVYRDTLRSRPRHPLRSRPKSLLRSQPVKSYQQAKSPLGYSLPRHTLRSRPRSLPRSQPVKSARSQPRFY